MALGLAASAIQCTCGSAAPVIDVSSSSSSSPRVQDQAPAPKTAPNFNLGNVQPPVNKGSVTDRLANLERKLDARNRAQVNVQRQLDELQNEMNELRGVTELHTHQLSQVLERQRELYQELDRTSI